MRRTYRFFLLVILSALLTACAPPPATLSRADLPTPDYWPTDGWRSATPEQQGMDSARLAEMLEAIRAEGINLHSLLVIRKGYIVLEAYTDPYGPDIRHTVESNTKSVIGALVGIAVDQGKIAGAEQRMIDSFPGRMFQNESRRKEAITLGHLLTMSSGLDCADRTEPAQAMYNAKNWVGYLVDLPVVSAPGREFAYCSGSVHILSGILKQATGSTARDFANRHLFGPLGIAEVGEGDWGADPSGVTNGIAGLYLTPRELAKFGLLYLHRGQWDGQQIVSPEWVDASTYAKVHIGQEEYAAGLDRHFGYLFSIFPEQQFYGYLGMAGQDMFIHPASELVVVFNSGLKIGEEGRLLNLMTRYLLPAVQDGSLAANPATEARLQAELAAFHGTEQPVQALPPSAQAASGKVYRFDENPLGWSSLGFIFTNGSNEAAILFDESFELRVGLDNRYRSSEIPDSRPISMRGRWTEDGAFRIDYLLLGEFREQTITVRLNGDEVALTIEDRNFGGEPLALTGTAK